MIADQMEYIYTIYIGSDRVGDVYKVTDAYVVYTDIPEKDNSKKIFFDTKVEFTSMDDVIEVVPDEPLRELSSQPYVITTDKDIIYNDIMYESNEMIPLQCQYMAMPVVLSTQILEYTIRSPYDTMFIEEGYVRELKDAKHVIVPSTEYPDIGDLLIQKVEGDTFTSFNGRSTQLKGVPQGYIYLEVKSKPIFTGTIRYPPYTYTQESLVNKFKYLNLRLQKYGSERVRSLLNSLQCVSNRLVKDPNQFSASQVYDRVVTLVSNLK